MGTKSTEFCADSEFEEKIEKKCTNKKLFKTSKKTVFQQRSFFGTFSHICLWIWNQHTILLFLVPTHIVLFEKNKFLFYFEENANHSSSLNSFVFVWVGRGRGAQLFFKNATHCVQFASVPSLFKYVHGSFKSGFS